MARFSALLALLVASTFIQSSIGANPGRCVKKHKVFITVTASPQARPTGSFDNFVPPVNNVGGPDNHPGDSDNTFAPPNPEPTPLSSSSPSPTSSRMITSMVPDVTPTPSSESSPAPPDAPTDEEVGETNPPVESESPALSSSEAPASSSAEPTSSASLSSSESSPSQSPPPTETPSPSPDPTSTSAAPAETTPAPPASNNDTPASGDEAEKWVNAHNAVRGKHGAEPLVWDENLAVAAQIWAENCMWEHSKGGVGEFGENIAAGVGLTIQSAMDIWEGDIELFDPKNPEYSHWTQLVWKNTKRVGCATAVCSQFAGLQYDKVQFSVCEYDPPGNVIGNVADNVQY